MTLNKVIFEDFDDETQAKVSAVFKEDPDRRAWFGPGRYVMPDLYKAHADHLVNFKLRPDDIWVATFPRTGTTWTQEMTWLLANDLDYEAAKTISILERYPFVEVPGIIEDKEQMLDKPEEKLFYDYRDAENFKSPRFLKTHLPLSLLPPKLLDTSKMVYVTRDPRNVAVSYYHHNRLFKNYGEIGEFKAYWDLFRNDLLPWCPFFSHTKEAWAQHHHPNMMFLFYEDMIRDLPSTVKRVAKFLGKSYSDDQIQTLCQHLHFDKMKDNKSTHPEWMQNSPFINQGNQPFFRKGKAGGWEDHFDEEMKKQAEQYIWDNLKDTDLRFPSI